MNITKYISIALIALGAMTTACDNIDKDDRYEPVAKPELPGEPRTLLIQEFTGHNCRNCPTGAASIQAIAAAYPGRVITVGMHPEGGGPNTMPFGTQDFRCEEAQVMYLHYMPSGFPSAVFGGTKMSAQTTEWMSVAIPFMSLEAPLTIDASIDYDTASRELVVDYTVDMLQNVKSQLSVMAWVVESGIVGIQNDKGTYIPNYVHNHVLRASLNGDWGTPLGTNTNGSPLDQYITQSQYAGRASITLDPKWVADNCTVVLWVFNTATKEELQAVEIPVKAAEN